MNTRFRRFSATIGPLCVGAAITVSALGADADPGPGAKAAPAAPTGSLDAGAVAPFLAAAQRGEIVPPDVEDVEHMCALLTSCDKLPLPPSLMPADFRECVRKMTDELTSPSALGFSLTVRECGLRANSCNELRTCALRGARADACVGRGKNGVAGVCDPEGRAITCYKERVLAVRDCPRGGEQCAVRQGEAMCTLGPCTGEDKPSCSGSGTRIVHCDKSRLVSLDCAAFGLRCVGGDTPGCAASTPSCAGNAKRCDGNVSVACYNGHEVRVDCAQAGLACGSATAGNAVGVCVAPSASGSTCDPNSPAKCDNANIKYCFAGRPRSYFCKALGFSKCVVESKSAHCAN